SMRPKRSSAPPMIRPAAAGSAMSASTVATSGSREGLIVSEVATTAQPRCRQPATSPAPMPGEAPVMTTTLPGMPPPAPGRSGVARAGGDLVGVPHPQRRGPLETHQGDRREVTPGGVPRTFRGGQLGYRCAHKDPLHGMGLPGDRAPDGPAAPV